MTEAEKAAIIEALQAQLCLHPGTEDCMNLVRPAFYAIEELIEKVNDRVWWEGWKHGFENIYREQTGTPGEERFGTREREP